MRPTVRASNLVIAMIVALCACSGEAERAPRPRPTRPRIVALIVIDQLGEWSFDAKRHVAEAGLKRAIAGGRHYDGRYPYAATITGPGHAALGTGAPPAVTGVIGNEWYDRAAKKEMSQPTTESLSKKTIKADFRKIGEVEVFERQAIGQPGPLTVQDADGREHTETATPFNWTLQMFVPQGDEYALYEMNFVVLTAEQYQQDKQLLQPILDSLQYDVAAAPATTPASVTQP